MKRGRRAEAAGKFAEGRVKIRCWGDGDHRVEVYTNPRFSVVSICASVEGAAHVAECIRVAIEDAVLCDRSVRRTEDEGREIRNARRRIEAYNRRFEMHAGEGI